MCWMRLSVAVIITLCEHLSPVQTMRQRLQLQLTQLLAFIGFYEGVQINKSQNRFDGYQ